VMKGQPEMGESKKWPAVCAECGVETEVPFEPDPNRKVFCQSCFKNQPRKNRR